MNTKRGCEVTTYTLAESQTTSGLFTIWADSIEMDATGTVYPNYKKILYAKIVPSPGTKRFFIAGCVDKGRCAYLEIVLNNLYIEPVKEDNKEVLVLKTDVTYFPFEISEINQTGYAFLKFE